MKKLYVIAFIILACLALISFGSKKTANQYISFYDKQLSAFSARQQKLLNFIEKNKLETEADRKAVLVQLHAVRAEMKGVDFWLRYLDQLQYKKINGPLPVEWEVEASDRLKKPARREGAGLTLASLYLEEEHVQKAQLLQLLRLSFEATNAFTSGNYTGNLQSYSHFFLSNRLYLLNLASIYTTGFECPDTSVIIPELKQLATKTSDIYSAFNQSFTATPLTAKYLGLYSQMLRFIERQPSDYSQFDHFTFIRDYVNPLFAINQQLIKSYKVVSNSSVDVALNNEAESIFSKGLYDGQDAKGIFAAVADPEILKEIDYWGKQLFYDPILSTNNLRSCNSCYNSNKYFTDTLFATALQLDGKARLPRNSPTLINAQFNQLIMLDGKHTSLQNQVKDVLTNPLEMGNNQEEILEKILSCEAYSKAFNRLLAYTPGQQTITLDHVFSAITFYYSKVSNYNAPFDDAMNKIASLNHDAQKGFNLFMGKAQCATCHFVPQFNGVKPPFVSSEFEVLGVPANKNYTHLSSDKGRSKINDAPETVHAMRTGTVRNVEHTQPYMHNGVFSTLAEVVDFYDGGGGAGRGLRVDNQTLSSDSMRLTKNEKAALVAFLKSLSEKINFELLPTKLPASGIARLNTRRVGGTR